MRGSVARLALLFSLILPLVAVEHPFLLWTPAEGAAIRERIAREPWAGGDTAAI